MEEICVLKLHSVSDVITNSSTEIFMTATDDAVDILYGILQDVLDEFELGRDAKDYFHIAVDNEGDITISSTRRDKILGGHTLKNLFETHEDYNW